MEGKDKTRRSEATFSKGRERAKGIVTGVRNDLRRQHADGKVGKEWSIITCLAKARQGGIYTGMLRARRVEGECEKRRAEVEQRRTKR